MTWKDFDIEARTIHINKKAIIIYNSKDKKTVQVVEDFCKTECSKRRIVITSLLVNILKEHKEKQIQEAELLKKEWNENNLIFPTSNGTVPYTRNIQEKFQRIINKIGIKDATMHSLRNSYATRLFEVGVD